MKNKILFSIAFLFVGIANIKAQTGNVGIGTNTPTEKLEVNGNFKDSSFSTNWTPSIAYDLNYVVIYQGNLYRHLTTTNTATAPNADSVNWKSISSVATQETLTITSTGTTPTKATSPLKDYISATDDGTWVTVDFEYSHTNNAGTTAGTGDYLFKLPAGYAFNTTIHPVNTQASFVDDATVEVYKLIHLSGLMQADAVYSFRNYVVPYDATHFRIVTIDFAQWYFVGYANFVLTHARRVQKGSFGFKKL